MMYPDASTPFNQWTAEAMTSLFFDYVRSGRMNVASLITHRVSPLDADGVYNVDRHAGPRRPWGSCSTGRGCRRGMAAAG